MEAVPNFIIALDYSDLDDALSLVDEVGGLIGFYKVGSELFASAGRQSVESLKSRGKKVFLDLKLFDIPTTVEKTCKALGGLGVDMVDIHCLGGRKMMEAAVRGARSSGISPRRAAAESRMPAGSAKTKVIGVTMLTSFDEHAMRGVFGESNPGDLSVMLAGEGKESGLDGVVCSSSNVGRIKEVCGKDFLTVVPGIRPCGETAASRPGSGKDDHARTSTPGDAFAAGADYIVIGRPVTGSTDPRGAVIALSREK